ncbi:hypothetical protein BJX99DRAFT_235523 [Aspergillus californicus]
MLPVIPLCSSNQAGADQWGSTFPAPYGVDSVRSSNWIKGHGPETTRRRTGSTVTSRSYPFALCFFISIISSQRLVEDRKLRSYLRVETRQLNPVWKRKEANRSIQVTQSALHQCLPGLVRSLPHISIDFLAAIGLKNHYFSLLAQIGRSLSSPPKKIFQN